MQKLEAFNDEKKETALEEVKEEMNQEIAEDDCS